MDATIHYFAKPALIWYGWHGLKELYEEMVDAEPVPSEGGAYGVAHKIFLPLNMVAHDLAHGWKHLQHQDQIYIPLQRSKTQNHARIQDRTSKIGYMNQHTYHGDLGQLQLPTPLNWFKEASSCAMCDV